MAISANTDWEIRTTGSGTNGGGFKDLNPGTSVDYSQQASAQLALTDIVTAAAGAVSSVTGGFTAAMEGNVIYLGGGSGITEGYYQITGYTDTNNITVDRNAGVSGSGGTGNVGGAWKFDSTKIGTFFNTTNKGSYDITHVEAGTYTAFGTSGANTISAAYQRMKGYNTTRGDRPTGTNRPYLQTGNNVSYINWSGSYGQMEHLRMDSTYSSSSINTLANTGVFFVIRNCKVQRSGFTNAYAHRMQGNHGRAFQCEYEATDGYGLQISKEGCMAEWCYVHDSKYGIVYTSSNADCLIIENCIIDTCTTQGISVYIGGRVANTTVYNCGTGILLGTFYCSVVNSIIHTCTTGINGNEQVYSDNNCLYNNTGDRTGGVVAGDSDISSNPLLVDPANQDFTLDASSPAFNTGIKLGAEVGLP